MKTIICKVNLFDLQQNIQLIDDEDQSVIGVSHTDDLGPNIAMLCDKYNVNDIHLFGETTFLNQTTKAINEFNNIKYGSRPLNIEVN